MQGFEKLGVFYLGRPYDLAGHKPKKGWLLYDSKDLVTHAVCVGMTGSGKTGLCVGLLEEAAIDGIPAIAIDPKGDLSNLLLTFPHLSGQDFAPWVNEDDARKNGLSTSDYAAQQAEIWKKGLVDWGQDGDRIARLREAADFVVYTPGSHAGMPVSILTSFAAPPVTLRDDTEGLRERVGATATGLLGLLGLDVNPITSREHIFLSTILETAWKQGQDLDLAALIRQVQTPAIDRVGVMDLESFYPAKDRFAFAMQLNNLLAAPGFAAWLEGEALDIARILHTPAGKPRVAIFSIAHLNDAERMFFVTLLLSQIVGWVRAQSGTTSLRALLYMDEIFGYFPPVANPPSKAPLLTLLKQARAFGVGVVLATQNPVDLDYKGLANTGTWFIGRLQTERDKARVLEGLEGASAGTGTTFDRRRMEQLLAGLSNRVFLLHNVHEDAPEVFQTRWTLSYLRGPLTRNQIKTLMAPRKDKTESRALRTEPQPSDLSSKPSVLSPQSSAPKTRPMLPPAIPQYFVPIRGSRPGGAALVYQPMVLGSAQIQFSDPKKGLDGKRELAVLAPITEEAVAVDWDHAQEADIAVSDLEREPIESSHFAGLPAVAGKTKSYEMWKKDLTAWLFRNQKLDLLSSSRLHEVSQPGESERDFRIRLQQRAREQRDRFVEDLRKKYAPKITALQDRIRRAEHVVERESRQSRQSQIQAAISAGATLLGALMGRKTLSTSTIGRATTAARGAGRAIKEAKDVGQAQENVEALKRQLGDLEAQFKADTETLSAAGDPLTEILETVSLKPTKANIAVKLVALAWAPHWQDAKGAQTGAWQ